MLFAGHFDWCLNHDAPSLAKDEIYDVYRTSSVRNDDGFEGVQTEII